MPNKSRKVEKIGRNNQSLSHKNVSILRWLGMGFTIKKTAKKFNLSEKTIYKHRTNLILKGFITKYNELTEKGRKVMYYGNGEESFRLHGVRVSVDVPLDYQKRLEKKRYNVLALKNISYQKGKLGILDYPYFEIDRAKARIFPKRVVIYLQEIWAKSVEEATEMMIELIFDYIKILERLYKIELIQENTLSMAVVGNEYAIIKSIFAKKYRKDGNKLYLYDKDGKLRLKVDFSKGVDELEAVHKNYAEGDIKAVDKQIRDWLDNNPPTNSELAVDTNKALEIVSKACSVMLHLDKNFATYFRILEKLEKAVDKLSESKNLGGRNN